MTEPIALSLPDYSKERYYVNQIVDMYTFKMEYIGACAAGYQAAKYIFASPGWEGVRPKENQGVRRTVRRFLLLLGRTAVTEDAGVPAVNVLQDQYFLTSLSTNLEEPAPEPASVPEILQHESPGLDKDPQWLPAPNGPFALALCIYWSEKEIPEGK